MQYQIQFHMLFRRKSVYSSQVPAAYVLQYMDHSLQEYRPHSSQRAYPYLLPADIHHHHFPRLQGRQDRLTPYVSHKFHHCQE